MQMTRAVVTGSVSIAAVLVVAVSVLVAVALSTAEPPPPPPPCDASGACNRGETGACVFATPPHDCFGNCDASYCCALGACSIDLRDGSCVFGTKRYDCAGNCIDPEACNGGDDQKRCTYPDPVCKMTPSAASTARATKGKKARASRIAATTFTPGATARPAAATRARAWS